MFTLFHGQAAIEGGFSVNKDALQNNMLERTLVAKRIILDRVKSALAGNVKMVYKLDVNKEMMRQCRASRMRYEQHLTQLRNENKMTEKETKKRKLKEEIACEASKKIKMESVVKKLIADADKLAKKAEDESNLKLLAESNESRKKSRDLQESIRSGNEKMKKLEEELNSM